MSHTLLYNSSIDASRIGQYHSAKFSIGKAHEVNQRTSIG